MMSVILCTKDKDRDPNSGNLKKADRAESAHVRELLAGVFIYYQCDLVTTAHLWVPVSG
jgi:hypothetical protein